MVIFFIPSLEMDQMGDTSNPLELTFENGHLSVIGQSLTEIPSFLGENFGSEVRRLDLSYNSLSEIHNLEKFISLEALVLDNNQIKDFLENTSIPSLQTLWVNNNLIDDLKNFMNTINTAFPNLTYLSMLKNPACPNFFTGKDQDDYRRYRLYVIYRCKKLKFLDSSPVTIEERKEANRVGSYMVVIKPDLSQYKPSFNDKDSDLPALPEDLQPEGKGSARFGVSSYIYYGKHSEGNRFIMNEDL